MILSSAAGPLKALSLRPAPPALASRGSLGSLNSDRHGLELGSLGSEGPRNPKFTGGSATSVSQQCYLGGETSAYDAIMLNSSLSATQRGRLGDELTLGLLGYGYVL